MHYVRLVIMAYTNSRVKQDFLGEFMMLPDLLYIYI